MFQLASPKMSETLSFIGKTVPLHSKQQKPKTSFICGKVRKRGKKKKKTGLSTSNRILQRVLNQLLVSQAVTATIKANFLPNERPGQPAIHPTYREGHLEAAAQSGRWVWSHSPRTGPREASGLDTKRQKHLPQGEKFVHTTCWMLVFFPGASEFKDKAILEMTDFSITKAKERHAKQAAMRSAFPNSRLRSQKAVLVGEERNSYTATLCTFLVKSRGYCRASPPNRQRGCVAAGLLFLKEGPYQVPEVFLARLGPKPEGQIWKNCLLAQEAEREILKILKPETRLGKNTQSLIFKKTWKWGKEKKRDTQLLHTKALNLIMAGNQKLRI